MQNNRPFSPQQRPGILPPLSKYYYGPAVSPERSPSNGVDTGFNAPNPQQAPPTLPPRNPSNSISQYSSHQNGLPQQIRFPGPPPTAPPTYAVARSSYNPNTHGPMPGARVSPINPTWNQSSHSVNNTDTSKWGVNYSLGNVSKPQSELKPPLPPRGPSSQSQYHRSSPDSEAQYSQANGSFEYLRQVAYSPVPSPSISQGFTPPNDEQSQDTTPQFEPQRLPPPPPRKIPIYCEDVQSQESNSMPNQPLDRRDSSKSSGPRMGTEVQVTDDNIIQVNQSTADSLTGIGRVHGRDDSIEAAQPAEPCKVNGAHVNEQDYRTSGAGFASYHQVGRYEDAPQANTQPEHQQSRPQTPLRNDSIESSVHAENHAINNSTNQAQGFGSFYWHSPHSSAATSHDREQDQDIPGTSSLLDANPGPRNHHIAAPPRGQDPINTFEQTTNAYQSTISPYSASALGFGGPSDWEHLGDYDGEEVDDTELYIRPRSPIKTKVPTETSELPGDTALVDVPPLDVQWNQLEYNVETSRTLSEAQSVTSKLDPPRENHTGEIHRKGGAQKDPVDRSYDSVQPRASYKQASTLSPTCEQRLPNDQQPLPKIPPQTYLPQFSFEQKKQVPKLSEDATNGVHMDHHSDLTKTSIPAESSGPLEGHDAGAEIDTAETESGSLTVTQNERPAETSAVRAENHAHGEVQQPSSNHLEAPSEHQDQSQTDHEEQVLGASEISRENSVKQGSVVSGGSVSSKIKEMGDPYADLGPWAKASLDRYVAMLHEEASASTEAEKIDMFRIFIRKEWKLRAILYGADDERGDAIPLENRDTPLSRTNTLSFRRPASKALPALPPDAEQTTAEPSQPMSLVSPNMHRPSLASLMTTKEEGTAPRSSGEESFVLVDTPGGQRQQRHLEEDTFESYSPGGRPIQHQTRNVRKSNTTASRSALSRRPDTSHSNVSEERADNNEPAYTPFRYSQGYVDDADQPVDRRASFRPYAALKLEPIEQWANRAPEVLAENVHANDLRKTTDNLKISESAILSHTQATQASVQGKPADERPLPTSASDQRPSLGLRRFEGADFDPLTAVLPQWGHIPNDAVELSDFEHGIHALPDDFSFIHQHVVAWDSKAKKTRADNEKERQIRQGESEQRIDALFNDDEIGYGDIAELESEFKRTEAARKTDEDRAECRTFVEEVFNAVWTRLHFEIDQLGPLYEQYSGLAHETLAGKDMFEASQGQYALAPTMSALLTLHQKLEIRHQEAFEAVLERDRRLKKTEVASFYTLGNVSKVKQIEKQFENAERKAIAEYCKQRNARANRLMDVLDQNTLRGVGANQDYMEAVMKAVRRIASGRAFASAPASEPGLGMDEVIKAKAVTAVLAGSSEQIVQTFHLADMLLNAADYELSVATARLANADPTTFERLKEERGKEDAKLMRDLQHRLALIREDTRRTNDEIVKLLCFLGVQGGHHDAQPVTDPEHEQRLQKALEDAKRRNAQTAAGEGLP